MIQVNRKISQNFIFSPKIDDIKDLSSVKQFRIIHPKYGTIEFCQPVDLTGLDLLKIIRMERGMAELYSQGSPKVGTEINVRSKVTLNYGRQLNKNQLLHTSKRLKDQNAKLIRHNPREKTISFEVQHWSRYVAFYQSDQDDQEDQENQVNSCDNDNSNLVDDDKTAATRLKSILRKPRIQKQFQSNKETNSKQLAFDQKQSDVEIIGDFITPSQPSQPQQQSASPLQLEYSDSDNIKLMSSNNNHSNQSVKPSKTTNFPHLQQENLKIQSF